MVLLGVFVFKSGIGNGMPVGSQGPMIGLMSPKHALSLEIGIP